MFEITQNIITNPFWALLTLAILWLVLYILLETVCKISETSWKRLDYIWILTGFLAVITLISENSKDNSKREAQMLRRNLKSDAIDITYILKESDACLRYTKTNSSPDDIELRIKDQDKLCDWSKKYKFAVDTTGLPFYNLDTNSLAFLPVKTNAISEYKERFMRLARRINSELPQYNKYIADIKTTDWDDFRKSFGILLAVFAFAIRLSIVTHNIRESKKKKY